MKKILLLMIVIILSLSACTNDTSAQLNFPVEDLTDINYSKDYLYYNISFEDVSFNEINETSDILLLINLTTENGLSYCVWKEAHFEVEQIIYGEYDGTMDIIKYPIEAYNQETNNLGDYPPIESGLYLLYLEKNDENEYRITNNFNGLISLSNNSFYNTEVKLNSIFKYLIVENPLVITNEDNILHMSNNSYDNINFTKLQFNTITQNIIEFDYFYSNTLDKSYILYNNILFETQIKLD